MTIFLGSDHGGFEFKETLKNYLTSLNYKFIDCGNLELKEDDDYPDFAKLVCKKVIKTKDSFGILICKSGNGMVITANKFKGIYATLCVSEDHAIKAREHNNSNVLCLDSNYTDNTTSLKTVKSFLETEFSGMNSRHGRRFKKIVAIENEYCK